MDVESTRLAPIEALNFMLSARMLICTYTFLGWLASFGQVAYARDIVVGIVLDGPVQREVLPVAAIKREVEVLAGREFSVRFPNAKIVDGNWAIENIRAAVRQLLADPGVDVVITNGLIASHEVMQLESLSKPVIATVVADAVLQKLPKVDGSSGRNNLVYLADDHTVGSDLALFHRMLGFKHLAILVDQLFIETLPELAQTTANAQARLDINIELVPVEGDARAALDALPAKTDAVYIPPLPRFSASTMRAFAIGLIERGIPSFALQGYDTLELGLLMTGAGRNVDITRAARRVALNLQAILLGTNASRLKVGLSQPQKLAINMRTARALGYAPKWQELESAIVLHENSDANVAQITLSEALARSVESNLRLQVNSIERDLASYDVDSARSTLLPQLSASIDATHIDRDRANPGFSAERDSDFSLQASQVLYSERLRSSFDVAKLLQESQNHAYRRNVLDTIETTATAYLGVLQALALASVRSSNVSVTEKNLELAISRQRIGQAGRTDVLRWQSQIASDRQSFYAARADTDQAMTELKRILNLDLDMPIAVSDLGIASLLGMLGSERFRRFFDNPYKLELFQRYQVEQAVQNSPEMKQIDFQIAGQERNLLAAKRAYYVPDVSIVGQGNTNIHRGGAGSNLQGSGFDDEQWSLGLQATLPLFEGGARRAEKSIAHSQLRQLVLEREDIRRTVQARSIRTLQKTGGTYPAMRLSHESSAAAQANLELVTQAYSVGTVSVIDLLDAQDAALSAELSTAQARYAFMIDFVGVQRAVGDFDLLLDPNSLETWYAEVDAYFTRHGR